MKKPAMVDIVGFLAVTLPCRLKGSYFLMHNLKQIK